MFLLEALILPPQKLQVHGVPLVPVSIISKQVQKPLNNRSFGTGLTDRNTKASTLSLPGCAGESRDRLFLHSAVSRCSSCSWGRRCSGYRSLYTGRWPSPTPTGESGEPEWPSPSDHTGTRCYCSVRTYLLFLTHAKVLGSFLRVRLGASLSAAIKCFREFKNK